MRYVTREKPLWTIAFDTLCNGYQPVMETVHDKNGENPRSKPVTYFTEAEAQADIDADPEFYEDCFTCLLTDIGHKTIFHATKE